MSDAASARLARVAALFAAAREQPAAERSGWLARECAGDSALHAEVAELLALDRDAPPGEDSFLAAPPDPWTGRAFGRWRLCARIGAGGMGVVYRAERVDGEFTQQAAVKLLKFGLDRAEAQERFRRERQLLAQLAHPGIARLLDGGTTADGLPWLAMELVAGERLDDWCDARRLPIAARLELFLEVCAAVQAAHQQLVIHRDLKPGNVLVGADGRPKLLDFGIAKVIEAEAVGAAHADRPETRTVERRLTPEYASPEMVAGGPITTASDVFSLGVMLHELITGARPWRDAESSPTALERAMRETPPRRPSTVAIDAAAAAARGLDPPRLQRALRGDLDAIVTTALAAEPERRYPSVERFAADLRHHLAHEPISARAPGLIERVRKFVKRRQALAAALLVACVALAVGAAGLLLGLQRATRQADATARVNRLLRQMLVQLDPSTARGFDASLLAQLRAATQELDGGLLRDEPSIEVDLRLMLGRVNGALGYPGWAFNEFEKALALERRLGAAPDARTAELLRRLGWAERSIARYEPAVGHLREAIALIGRGIGDRADRVAAINDLALTLTALAQHGEAAALLEGTIAHEAGAGRGKTTATASLIVALALDRLAAGKAATAEAPARDALALMEELLPEADPRRAIAIDTVARVLLALGRASEAEPLLERSLALRRGLFDPRNPVIAWSLGLLADARCAAGRPGDAIALLEEAWAIRAVHYDPGEAPQVETRLQLGLALLDAGRAAEARPHLEQAIAWAQEQGNTREPRLARGRAELLRMTAAGQ